jgi:glycine/D-amino acid oxidase-like deaminating enzyme
LLGWYINTALIRVSASLRRAWKIDCDLVSPQEAQKLCPLIAVDDLQGGLWIPGDGVGDPYQICLSLISAAKEGGKSTEELMFVQPHLLWW